MNYHPKRSHASSAEEIYAKRVAPVNALHIANDDGRKALERVQQLVIETTRDAGEVLLLTGAPMAGRRETVRQVARAPWLAPVQTTDGRLQRPFIAIDARAQSRFDDCLIIEALAGISGWPKNSIARHQKEVDRLRAATEAIGTAAHRIIAITNAEQMLHGKNFKELDLVAGKIALLASETGASFILTGGSDLLAFVRSRLDLIGSVSHVPLQSISGTEEFVAMLEAFEQAAGLQPNAALRDDKVVDVILDFTQRLRGRTAQLLREAVKGAIFDDVDTLSMAHVAKVVDRTPLAVGDNPLASLL